MAGAGKSSIGKKLAKHLSFDFVDSDLIIEKKYGESLQNILNEKGNKKFEEIEEGALLSVQFDHIVLATGGGAIESENNRRCLASNGFVIYLETSIEDQVLRAKPSKKRPLLQNVEPKKKLQELMQKRKSLYESIADTIVNTEGHKPHSLAQQVIGNFDAHRNSKP